MILCLVVMWEKQESDVHTIEIPDASRLVCCFCDIPKILRKVNPAAYTPQLISIGPIHHGRAELAKMEKDKLKYAKNFLIRTKKKEDLFVQFIQQHEQRIRECYAYNPSKLEKREYVAMILLDSFFIFELFIRCQDKAAAEYASDSLLHDTWLWNNVLVDLLLFENQLPYSFLSELYELSFGKDDKEHKQFHELCLTYFDVLNQKKIILQEDECKKQLHFTGLIRRFKCGETSPKETDSKSSRSLKYTAKKLSESKVKFSSIQDGSLNDITFNDRELKLPIFTIDNTTERICCNLMGLEQYQFKENADICSYIMLWHLLIRTTNDVTVLIEDGVLINKLDSNQAVVEMFNKLCKNINVNHFYFSKLCGKLDHYCSSWKGWWNYCWKILTDVYFTNVWSGTGTIAAVILLLLTLIQTITSILQV
ncbi:hypothetical protein ACFE04_001814 [Oxalis oulophora]